MVSSVNFSTNFLASVTTKKNFAPKLPETNGATPITSSVQSRAATQVNISNEATNKLQLEQTSDAASYKKLPPAVRNNPALAAQFAYDKAHSVEQPLFNISGGLNNIRYSQTGEPVTPENLASFERLTNEVSAKKLALYQEEKSKGTPDADIHDKLVDLISQQSQEFRSAIGFELPAILAKNPHFVP